MNANITIYHMGCPKQPDPDGEMPELRWGGFDMAGAYDMVCPLCGMSIMVCEE
jgi:hypothetical protein